MYLQEVVISPDIFEKVHKAFAKDSDEFLDMKSYLKNLKLKKIIFESEPLGESLISNEYFRFRDNSDDEQKRCIKAMLDTILVSERISVKKVDGNSAYCKDTMWNTLLCLSLKTESKIINAEMKGYKALALKHKELSEIEILNFEEFIKPPESSRLMTLDLKKIEIPQRGTKFMFEDILRQYFTNAKTLIVNDRHVRIRNQGFVNFKRILSLCKCLEEVKISTTLEVDKKNTNFKPDISEEELRNEIYSITGIAKDKIIIENGEHMRYLRTEDFRFRFEPNLWFVKDDYRTRGRVVIDIEHVSTLKD